MLAAARSNTARAYAAFDRQQVLCSSFTFSRVDSLGAGPAACAFGLAGAVAGIIGIEALARSAVGSQASDANASERVVHAVVDILVAAVGVTVEQRRPRDLPWRSHPASGAMGPLF